MQVDSQTELVIAVEIARRLEISPQRVNVFAGDPVGDAAAASRATSSEGRCA